MTKEMSKRITSLFLALIMILQILIPQNIFAEEEKSLPQDKYIKVGMIDEKSYGAKIMNELNRIAAKNRKQGPINIGTSLFSSGPYFGDNNEPKDADKPKYFGNVSAKLDLKGLDGNTFQWNEIFGVDESENPNPAQIIFRQMDAESGVDTGLYYMLQITKEGKYTWSDGEGKPTKLPLFSKSLKPYKYEVRIDERVSDKVKLLTEVIFGTEGSSPTFSPENADGEIIANITLGLTYQQIASTKFKSEWHTGVDETDRPGMKANFAFDDEGDGMSPVSVALPKNDKDTKIIRDWYNEFDPDLVISYYLEKTPDVKIDENTAGLTFDTTNKTVKSGDYKFKYDFNYDVINGGKLTMTEVIPVTFDANGGKFASITDPNADQKIIKEVDYDGALTDQIEKPSKSLETFKGWSTTQDGKNPVTDADFKNIKEAKTFYAIWDNNDLVAEELEVKESFKDGTGYVNDFIPTLDQLKGQVKIKDAEGNLQALANDDTFAIIDGTNEYTTDAAAKDFLYEKLQEKDDGNKPSRTETITAKITHANGTSQTVDIPIKVIKNIYEAKTLTEKPFYVPKDYVKVTLDPTTKATDPQKTVYYVNPDAKVVIPGTDPTGKDDYKFIKWTIPGTPNPIEYKLADRHQFSGETTITAQYSKDIIPQEGNTKPEGVPDNFVKVTFVPTENGTLEGNSIFYVNPEKEVTIPVKDPVGKQYFTFKEWKIGVNADGDVYTPSNAKKFTEATTITATYDEAKNIIPYNPEEPITRPEGYVRVTFAAETGLKLTESKAYYVKANAKDTNGDALTLKAIKDDATNYGYPAYKEETGYKFKEWDKEDTLQIGTADIVVTAKATKLDNVIPEKKDDGTQNEKPEGYKEVTFVIKTGDESKGSITGVAKFYVNPNEYVTINPPKTNANTGYKFGSWDKDTTIPRVYDKDTTITGSFNGLKDVIPKTNPDGSENTKPEGYKTVTFVIDPATGGKIADGEVTVYYVNPAKEVTVPQPKTKADTGYEFEKWNQDTTTAKKYTEDTTVKGSFKKLDDIVDGSKPKPEGYVTLTFEKGDHGKEITGQTVYYVNPEANPAKTLGDPSIVKPTVKAETGYKFTSWNFADTKEITSDITVTAQYTSIEDVIPKTNPQGGENTQPDGYITVTFDKGANGELEGNTIFYVNPNKAVVLEGKAPTIKPNTGYTSAGWDTTINKAIQYKDGDKITALYNKLGDVIPQEKTDGSDKPAGYLTVTFDKGDHGELSGKTVYYVKPNKEVTVPAPTVKPSVGYEFDKWDKALTQTFTEDTTIEAGYKALENIIPQKNTDGSDKPNGYVTVTFKADGNGSLSGTTVYYVKPNVDIDLTDTAKNITKNPNVGYTAEGGTWTQAITKKQYTADETYTFNFVKLDDVIPKDNPQGGENTKPDDYVTVKLIPTEKATDETKAEKVYFVNPKKDVTIENTPVGTEFKDANGITYKYTFTGWRVTSGTINSWNSGTINGQFIQDTEITAKYSTKVDAGTILPAPVPKKDAVTAKGDTPKPEDLIKNIPGSENDPLPNGTEISYKEQPKVDETGKITAKVEVKYPNGKTVVVEVPITVVDNVVPQIGGENGQKPLVPDTYVKVTVDTTDKATDNTKFVKVFWVKPNTEVTLPDIFAPTGRPETDANGVTNTNNFKKWKLEGSNPEKFYENEIKDTFKAKESKIVAIYEFDKNVDPVPNDGIWVPKGLDPKAKDFIKNAYDDNDHNNKGNLPPGTKFEFVPGKEPNTDEPGTNKTTIIKVIYPNGETKEVPVTYNVTDDVVEQTNPNKKPDVPDNFVKVIVDKTENAQLQPREQQTQVFWVNPEKVVKIPVGDPTGKVETKPDGTVDYTWKFTGWDNNLTQQFEEQETKITAQYKKDFGGLTPVQPIPDAYGDFIYTDYGKEVTDKQYKDAVKLPDGYSFENGTTLEIVEDTKPNVNKNGRYDVSAWVKYPNGQEQLVKIIVFVGEKVIPPTPDNPDNPNPWNPNPWTPGYIGGGAIYIGGTIEKKVEVPAKAKPLRKEVRYMQGFNGYFRPNDGLTRAEAAQILANALVEDGYNYNPDYKISYPDIGNEWYTRAIKITTEANVFAGYDDGLFRPEKKITRAEWVATLRRFQNIAEAAGNHMNLSGNHWAKAEIEGAFNEGWLKIYTDGLAKFNADEFIPRQEVAAVSNRAFNRVFDKTYIDRNDNALINQYKDVKRTMWAYEDILCASNTFVHDEQLYRAHDVKNDKLTFNVDLGGLEIIQDKFQRILR